MVAIVVITVCLFLCCPWFVFLGQWLNYDHDRPESEQPFFKDLGFMMRLSDYLSVLLLSLVLLIGAVGWGCWVQSEIRNELAFTRAPQCHGSALDDKREAKESFWFAFWLASLAGCSFSLPSR